MNNKFVLGKNALIISIMTLITVLVWAGLEIYRAFTKNTIPTVTQEQMGPLDPKLKRETIENLKESIWFSEEELNNLKGTEGSKSSQKI